MSPAPEPAAQPVARRKMQFGCLHVLGIVLIVMLITGLFAGWWVKHYIYASPYKPTQLSPSAQKKLDEKLARLDESAPVFPDEPADRAQPERYSEDDAKREIRISQKELNALVAKDLQAAKHVAIDLSDDLISVNTVLPLDSDLPVLGGKMLRIKFGVMLRFVDGQAVASMRGVSIGGVPLPSAWWGDIKNKNLVKEFSDEGGFWDRFSRGVEQIQVTDGHLVIRLKE